MASYADALTMLPRATQQEIVEASRQSGRCRDCASSQGGVAWVDVTHGALLCVRCAGRHRGFEGVRVKSLSLDAWHPDEVAALRSRMATPHDSSAYAAAIAAAAPPSRAPPTPRARLRLLRSRTVTPEPPSLLATATAARLSPPRCTRSISSSAGSPPLSPATRARRRATSDPAAAATTWQRGAKAFSNQINVCTPSAIQELAARA